VSLALKPNLTVVVVVVVVVQEEAMQIVYCAVAVSMGIFLVLGARGGEVG
jgi:hypothetical protein